MKSKKTGQEPEHVQLNRWSEPATEVDALYEIVTAIAVLVEATNTQTTAIVSAIHKQTSEIEDLQDVLRATNEILIQRHLYGRAGKDLARVQEQIEKAKKTLLRQGKKA